MPVATNEWGDAISEALAEVLSDWGDVEEIGTDPNAARKSALRKDAADFASQTGLASANRFLSVVNATGKAMSAFDRLITGTEMTPEERAAGDAEAMASLTPKERETYRELGERADLLKRVKAVESPVSTGLRESAVAGAEAMRRPSSLAIMGGAIVAPEVVGPALTVMGIQGAKDAAERLKQARETGDRTAYYRAVGDLAQTVPMVGAGARITGLPRLANRALAPKPLSPADVPELAAQLETKTEGVQNASQIESSEKLHADVPAQPVQGQEALPVKEGGEGVLAVPKEQPLTTSEQEAVQKQLHEEQPALAGEETPAQPVGMGAMAAGELTPFPQTPTSIRNATVDSERAQRGLPPVTQAAKRAFGTVWDEAMATIDRDPAIADRLVEELRNKPRSITDAEDAILLHRQVDLQNEFGKATRDLARAYEDGQVEVAAAEQTRVNILGDQLRDLYDIGKRSGTETARGLAARRMFANEDFTLASMTMAKRAANEGRPLTTKETAELAKAQARISELETQLADAISRGESGKTGGKGGKPALDPAVLKAKRESELAKAEWHESLARDRFDQLSAPRRLFHYGKQTYDAARVLLTAFDFSAVLRQGKFILAAHPARAASALPDMFRSFASKAVEYRVEQEIAHRPNARRYRDSGLYLAERDAPLTRAEDNYTSTWAKKIPGVAGSQRAYNTFLNRLRVDSFDAMANSLSRTKTPTPAEYKAIANFINAATGRGNLGALETAAVGLNRVFFAPRYVASRFQLILGSPMYKGTGRTRALIAQEYARTLAGYAAFYTLSRLALQDSTVETDPRSSDAGKVKMGNTRLDPLAGLQQNTVLLSRLGTGETTNMKGKTVPIRGERVPYGGTTVPDVLTRFVRSKLAPIPGAVVNAVSGEDMMGQPVTAGSTIKSLTVPISWQDIAAAMEDQGIPRGTALGILSIFGEGLQVYDDRPRR